MSDEEFFEFLGALLEQVGERTADDAHYAQAVAYPWRRPPGSCLVTDGHVEDLARMSAERRHEVVSEYMHADNRVRLLAYGANAAPERLALKLAHLGDEDRRALILAGDLEGFDVGAAAQGPWFSSMPGTLVASPGTAVRVGVLFLTPLQFTTLWWTEVSYKLGELADITLETDAGQPVERVLAFVSRFGAFCVDGEPVAMSAIAARDRRWRALTQAEILAAAARITLGGGAGAPELVAAAYERPTAFMAEYLATLRSASRPFDSPNWTEMPVS
jgi:hypothetical protein